MKRHLLIIVLLIMTSAFMAGVALAECPEGTKKIIVYSQDGSLRKRCINSVMLADISMERATAYKMCCLPITTTDLNTSSFN